jgi:ABC-type thiamin/hydroxymethylpyrimidine transport system permease subunit
MKTEETFSPERPVYYRLIALWVMVEAVLGGMIHGLKLPVSGLIVGSCAVLCICLIAYYVPARGAILKATVVVAIFKMMLSPQSPPAAYLAVFFQGVGTIVIHLQSLF